MAYLRRAWQVSEETPAASSLRRLARPRTLPRFAIRLLQHRGQEFARIAPRCLDDILWRTPGDDLAAAVAAFGAEVDDPVGGLDAWVCCQLI